ncbi:MAG: hypothetical protein J6Q54_07600 [Oscillospiraceae bacterium]|nr:hypothetical protein [Oscillospiraceae bacterium]
MRNFYNNLNLLKIPVQELEKEPVEKGKILFYGHSLFTRWSEKYNNRRLDEDIRMKDGSLACVNHGFGGSNSEDLLFYYSRLVRPWEPRALVLISLANDGMYAIDLEQSITNIVRLCHWARADFPDIPIYIIESHPHPKMAANTMPDRCNVGLHRKNYYNQALAEYAAAHEGVKIIQLWDKPEFFKEGQLGNFREVREELFEEDGVHLNQAGYDIFGPIIKEALEELL